MSLLNLVTAAMAIWQVVEIWHHGQLFADWRSRVETWAAGVKGWVGNLLTCPWCLSVWVGFLVCGNLLLSDALGAPWVAFFPYAFAASRLANVGNDLTHHWCRTPKVGAVVDEGDAPNAYLGSAGGPVPPAVSSSPGDTP